MGSRGKVASLCNVFCGPHSTNQMGIEALISAPKNVERKLGTESLAGMGLSMLGKKEEGRTLRIGEATTVDGEKLLQVGQKIRTIGREIDMIDIRSTVSCTNLEFFATEVQ